MRASKLKIKNYELRITTMEEEIIEDLEDEGDDIDERCDYERRWWDSSYYYDARWM